MKKKELEMFLLFRPRGQQPFCQDTSKFVRYHHILIKWSHCSIFTDLEFSVSAMKEFSEMLMDMKI